MPVYSRSVGEALAIAALLVFIAGVALGDRIILTDGRVIEGEIVRETDASVTLRLKLGEETFERDKIKSIEYGPIENPLDEQTGEAENKQNILSESRVVSMLRRYMGQENAEKRRKLAGELETTYRANPELVERVAAGWREYGKKPKGHSKGSLEIAGKKTEYALFVPEKYDSRKAWPLLVALHGRGGNGPAYIRLWHVPVEAKLPRDQVLKYQQAEVRGYVVVAPTAREEWGWGPAQEAEAQVLGLIDKIREDYNIDLDRIYVQGLSMGACGAWRFGLHYADMFAAIEPRAGGYDLGYVENARNLPVYITHGDKDESVPVGVSRDAAGRLEELGYDYRYSEIAGGGHQFFIDENPKVLDYFEKKKRSIYPEKVVWTADRPEHGRAYWLEIEEFAGSGRARVEGSCDRDSNTIEIKTGNVKKLTVYLSRHMVDFTGPVVVKVNGVQKHNGVVDDSSKTLLEILRKTGDGKRLFPAAIRLEIE